MNDEAVAPSGLPRSEAPRPETLRSEPPRSDAPEPGVKDLRVRDLGMKTVLDGGISDVKARVVEALKQQGFGVLSEIDVKATLKEKLGEEIDDYLILGACNPALAHRALQTDPSIGLLLPCNVVLRYVEPQRVEVAIIDPELMFAVVPEETKAKIPTLAGEARTRLQAALEAMARG